MPTITEKTRKKIEEEFNNWIEHQYAGKTLEERQELGQFFTPPDLTIEMLEKFKDLDGSIIDPTAGCGGLLAACIIAGADPKQIYGIELDPVILDLCRQRLEKLGVPKYNIHLGSALNPDCWDHFTEDYSYDIPTDRVRIKGRNLFSFGFQR